MAQSNQLSDREQEVVKLLLEGKSNKLIASALGISDRTVEFQLGGLETSLFELGLARLEMTVGPVDQRDNRVQFRNYSLGGR